METTKVDLTDLLLSGDGTYIQFPDSVNREVFTGSRDQYVFIGPYGVDLLHFTAKDAEEILIPLLKRFIKQARTFQEKQL